MTTQTMTDRDHDLTEDDKVVLEVFREEEQVSPLLIRNLTGLEKGEVNTALTRLSRRGYVKQRVRGLYKYVGEEDPEDV